MCFTGGRGDGETRFGRWWSWALEDAQNPKLCRKGVRNLKLPANIVAKLTKNCLSCRA